jgi:hypothetical protein
MTAIGSLLTACRVSRTHDVIHMTNTPGEHNV